MYTEHPFPPRGTAISLVFTQQTQWLTSDGVTVNFDLKYNGNTKLSWSHDL